MKIKNYFIGLVLCTPAVIFAQNIGIGTVTPHASAMLEVSSTTKGLLAPVMTKAQRDAIANPANGLLITCTDCPTAGLQQYINGAWESVLQNNTESIGNYGTVVNPKTGKVWLDRNLGATRVATSSTDALAFGDLYQWGRNADGHQLRTSSTSTTLAGDYFTNSGSFIITNTAPNNWMSNAETHMWSGTAAENNPCPCGFRIPTAAEWLQEQRTWSSSNAFGAFASPLKLPLPGLRIFSNGEFESVGLTGYYWTSTKSGTGARAIYFHANIASMFSHNRAFGFSIRCIKD